MSKIATCRSCHDPIVWAVTEAGKRIPLNAEPVIGGNMTLTGSTARMLSADGQRLAATMQQPRHVAHFVTCPQSGRWRSK